MELTIIVPVYNGEKYLARCLQSIVEQNISEMEILVINDGSTDRSKEIIEEFQKKYSNIVLINKKNGGLPQARKTGVKQAKGKYIGFVDADDWIEPDMYQKMYQAAVKYKAEIVCCGICINYENGKEVKVGVKKDILLTKEEAYMELHKRSSVYPYAWNKLFYAKTLQDVTFPEGNFVGEDYYIITQVLEKVSQIVCIKEKLYHYLQLSGSMCRGGYTDNYLLAYSNYWERYLELINKFPNLNSYFLNYIQIEFMSFIIAMGKNRIYNKKMINEICKLVRKNFYKFNRASYIGIEYKISSVCIAINYRILIFLYKVLKH